jgi:hypothetical protein
MAAESVEFEEFAAALARGVRSEPVKATSIRIPEDVHRLVELAAQAGMDKSFTAAVVNSLLGRVRDFARQQALANHFRRFPTDIPDLAAVAKRRASGSAHPAVERPDLIDEAAKRVEHHSPNWAVRGDIDGTIDRVLDFAELLATEPVPSGA